MVDLRAIGTASTRFLRARWVKVSAAVATAGILAVVLSTVQITSGHVADLARFGALASIWAILALALNLQWGHTGLFNAGIVGFWGLGAYVAAIVVTNPVVPATGTPGHWGIDQTLFPAPFGLSMSFGAGVIVAAFVAAVAGFLIAIPALRLRADYLAIATLGLAEIIMRVFVKNLQGVTGGVFGITGIPRPFEFGTEVYKTELSFFILVLVAMLVLLFVIERMTRSPWGRALRAVREDEDAAEALGKDTFLLKLQAFVFGAAIMGAAGAFFAYWLRSVFPPETMFTPLDTFAVWVIVIIGGSGNNRGVVLGAWVVLFLEYASVRAKGWFDLDPAFASQIFFLRLIVIGLVLIALVLARPQGLLPQPKHVAKRPRFLW